MDMQCGRCKKSIDITEAIYCAVHGEYYCDDCYEDYHQRHNEYEPTDPEWVLSDSRRKQ